MREICFHAGLAILVFVTVLTSVVLAASLVAKILPGRGRTDWRERCDELAAYIRSSEKDAA